MATQSTYYPEFSALYDPQLVVEAAGARVDVFFESLSEAARLADDLDLDSSKDRLLLLSVTEDALTMYPLRTRRGKEDYLAPKYGPLRSITLEDDWELPTSSEDVVYLLEGLPEGFSKRFQYGLGLKYEYRFLLEAISSVPEVSELVMPKSGQDVAVDGSRYILRQRRFQELRKSLNRVQDEAQKEAREVKRLISYANLKHAALPGVFPLRLRQPKPGAIQLLAPEGKEVVALPKQDQAAAVRLVRGNATEIAQTAPRELLQLKADIELVTLTALIIRFEEMLQKDLGEDRWQQFFKDNPFILSLAFAYPVLLIDERVYVGTTTFSGSGGKFTDFVVASQYTGNLAVIEIKKPSTDLLTAKEYRTNVYGPSTELAGSIAQVLDQRLQLQRSLPAIKDASGRSDVQGFSVQCIVIVGTSEQDIHRQKSFDLLRHSSSGVHVITFDELLSKLKEIARVFTTPPPDNDVPF